MWQLGDGGVLTANTSFASSFFVMIAQLWLTLKCHNLVILGPLACKKRGNESTLYYGENPFVWLSTKWREIPATKHWVRPRDRWGLKCYSAPLPSGSSRRVKAEAYGARCEDDAIFELLMLARHANLCVNDTTSMFECAHLRHIDKATHGAQTVLDARNSYAKSGLRNVTKAICWEEFHKHEWKISRGI